MIIGCPHKNDLNCIKEMIESIYNSTGAFDELAIVANLRTGLEIKVDLAYTLDWLC